MEVNPDEYFLQMIRHLRQHEEVMLYGNILNIIPSEMQRVADYLKIEYERECLDYPGTTIPFDSHAALWAGRTVYTTAQLILYRENGEVELPSLLPAYHGAINASAILSADICLRFLPDMIAQLKFIDSQDLLVEILEQHLTTWHYSGVSYALDIKKLDFTSVHSEDSLFLLYCDRIVENKKLHLAQHPAFSESIHSQLSIHAQDLWSAFS